MRRRRRQLLLPLLLRQAILPPGHACGQEAEQPPHRTQRKILSVSPALFSFRIHCHVPPPCHLLPRGSGFGYFLTCRVVTLGSRWNTWRSRRGQRRRVQGLGVMREQPRGPAARSRGLSQGTVLGGASGRVKPRPYIRTPSGASGSVASRVATRA
jgi:hypothetical protein